MATQTVLSAPPEEVEKEEVKKMEAEKVSLPQKESTKSEESESLCPSVEAKIEEEKVPIVQNDDLDNTNADEEPKGVPVEPKPEDKPVELPPPAEVEVDDKPVELLPTFDEKKTEDAPIVDKGTPEVVVPAPDTACAVVEPTIEKDDIKSKLEYTNEEKPEKTEEVVDVPKSSPAEVDTIEVKGGTIPEGESTPQEAYVAAPVVEDKIPEKIEKEGVVHEPLVNVEGASPADEVEDARLLEKVETCANEAPTIQVEEKHVDSNPVVEANKETERATSLSSVEPGVPDEKCVVTEANEVTEQATEPSGVEPGKNEIRVPDKKSVVAEANAVTEQATGLFGVEHEKKDTEVTDEKSVAAEANEVTERATRLSRVEPGKNETGVPDEKSVAAEANEVTEQSTGLSGVEPGKNKTGVPEEKSVVAEKLVPCEEERATETVEVIRASDVEPGKNEIAVAKEKSVEAEELVPCEEEKATETVEVTGASDVEPGKNEIAVVEEKSVVAEELVPCEEEKATETVEVTGVSGVETGKSNTVVAEEKSVVDKELLLPCEEKKTSEDAKVGQGEATSRDIEPVCDKGNNVDKSTVVKGEDETTKIIDEKLDEKILETPQANEEKQVNEGVENEECAKDSEDTKTYQDVPIKKQSFVKIVKQSLVKAKKAIIGKSQNAKAPSSEPKDDGNK